MTTIAFDGETLAADSQVTCAYIELCGTKIRRMNGTLCGAAGAAQDAELFFIWVKAGMPKEKPDLDKDDFCALLVSKGKVIYFDNKLIGIKSDCPAAVGSGSRYAVAAMHCGKTAKEAVKVAARFDPFTGGRIRTLKCP